MSTVKQSIQLLEAGNRRLEHAARLFKTNGNSGVAFDIKEKVAEIEILIARVKEANRND